MRLRMHTHSNTLEILDPLSSRGIYGMKQHQATRLRSCKLGTPIPVYGQWENSSSCNQAALIGRLYYIR